MKSVLGARNSVKLSNKILSLASLERKSEALLLLPAFWVQTLNYTEYDAIETGTYLSTRNQLRRLFGPKRDEVTRECRRLHNEGLYAV